MRARARRYRRFPEERSGDAARTIAAVPGHDVHPVLQMQRAFGNQTVQQVLENYDRSRFTSAASAHHRPLVSGLWHVFRRPQTPLLVDVAQRAPSTLETSASAKERANLQVLTTESVTSLSAKEIKQEMTDKDKAAVPADAVTFSPDIAAEIKPGLQNIAGKIFKSASFTFNTVTHLPLDLKPYGGVNGVYRFTIVQRQTKPKVELIIEQVSSSPPMQSSSIDLKTHQKRFDSFGFSFGPGFGSDGDKKRLFAALARVPDALLNRVKGLKFAKYLADSGERDEPGHYDPNTHTVNLYKGALETHPNSADAGGAQWFTYIIAHEVGHAIDYEAYTNARVKRDALAKQLKEAQLEAKRVNPSEATLDEKAAAETQAKKQKEITRLQKELDKAEAVYSKAARELDTDKGGEHSQSKEFRKAEGKAISGYGARGKSVENFAELFSVYVLDPGLLKSLRPDAHKYFTDTFK